MVDIQFLGGCREIGDLGMLIDNGKERVVFEFGTNIQSGKAPIPPKMPLHGVFLSHAHLDHSGNIPVLYASGYMGRTWATPATHELTELLLRDSLKVQYKRGIEPPFSGAHIAKMQNLRQEINFGGYAELKSCGVRFNDAGHIPGGSSLLYETEGKRILYTGDIKFEETALTRAACQDYKDIDVLITETTYAMKNHSPRKELVKTLKDMIEDVINNSGTVLLPSFAVGRTQEMLCLLHGLDIPIHLDGMGIEATKRILRHPGSVKSPKTLRNAFREAHKVRRPEDRKKALEKPGIIICTAGMLQGGPVSYYIQNLHHREDCAMILNGYQVEGTAGRVLMETGRYTNDDVDVRPKMLVKQLDFSAHCGRDNLISFIEKVSPETVVMVHGEHTVEFASEMNQKGFKTLAPEKGEKAVF